MANEQKKGNTAVPLIIIGVVLIAIVGIGYWLYSQSKPSTSGNNSNAKPTATQARATPNVNAPIGANPPNQLGSPTAAVTVEEFADFQCPTCASMHPVMKEVQSTYGSKIRFVFRNYPLPMHDKSYDAAVAAEAAGLQGKFWQMQDQLFTNQQGWSTGTPGDTNLWVQYAQKIGLDTQKFLSDMNAMPAKERVNQDLARAKALGVNSTPSVFVNGQLVPFGEMNPAGMRRIIDAELQRTASQAQSTAPVSAPASTTAAANSNSNSK
jgi:protein-disulfide isomerase